MFMDFLVFRELDIGEQMDRFMEFRLIVLDLVWLGT